MFLKAIPFSLEGRQAIWEATNGHPGIISLVFKHLKDQGRSLPSRVDDSHIIKLLLSHDLFNSILNANLMPKNYSDKVHPHLVRLPCLIILTFLHMLTGG